MRNERQHYTKNQFLDLTAEFSEPLHPAHSGGRHNPRTWGET